MRLFTREWGSGERNAVLVHGVLSDSRNWRTVGPALADLGYHVIAVDLRGHGNSSKADRYSPELFADDLVETVPSHPELIMGHSLGGLAVSLAVERIQPERAIYVDPAFSGVKLAWWQRFFIPIVQRRIPRSTEAAIAKSNPKWDPEDVTIEAETFRSFDMKALRSLLVPGALRAPEKMVVPSLVVLADDSQLVKPELAEQLRSEGYVVRVVAGTSHTVNRDDFDGFMAALDGWV
jgi:pimeloyl-ACP methyl ester carboxylesterase